MEFHIVWFFYSGKKLKEIRTLQYWTRRIQTSQEEEQRDAVVPCKLLTGSEDRYIFMLGHICPSAAGKIWRNWPIFESSTKNNLVLKRIHESNLFYWRRTGRRHPLHHDAFSDGVMHVWRRGKKRHVAVDVAKRGPTCRKHGAVPGSAMVKGTTPRRAASCPLGYETRAAPSPVP